MTARKSTIRRTPRLSSAQARKGMRFGGYLRVSAEGERDTTSESYVTVKDQRGKIEAYAKRTGVTITEWYDDSGSVSGKTMDRPELERLRADLRAGTIEGAAVAYLDRFSRAKPSDAMEVVQEFVDGRWPLAILDMEGVDTAAPAGEFILSAMLAVARLYSRQRHEKWVGVRANAVEHRHLYIANSTPFGYLRVDSDGEPVGPHARSARLDVHPIHGPIVTELYRRRAAGEGWATLCRWLQSTGAKPPARRKKLRDDEGRKITVERPQKDTWGTDRVFRMLKRRVYLGEIDDSKYSGVAHEGAHPPLTDPITWQAANDRQGTAVSKRADAGDLLAGFVRCASCRYMMMAINRTDTETSRLHGARRYICKRHASHYDCPSQSSIMIGDTDRFGKLRKLSDEQADELRRRFAAGEATRTELGREYGVSLSSVKNYIQQGVGTVSGRSIMGLDSYVIEEVFAYLDQHEQEILAFGESDALDALKAEAEHAQAELESDATDLGLQELLGMDMWRKRIAERRRVAEQAREDYESKQRTVERPVLDRPVKQLREEWPDMSLADKRSLLRALIQCIFVRSDGLQGASADRVRIIWATDPPVDIPRQGRSGWIIRPFTFEDAN